jgi:hypothetical protein
MPNIDPSSGVPPQAGVYAKSMEMGTVEVNLAHPGMSDYQLKSPQRVGERY